MPAKKKRTPVARSFYCSGCAKKRKMPFLTASGFLGTKTYQCPYCGYRKTIG